jgi:hypothetical protein
VHDERNVPNRKGVTPDTSLTPENAMKPVPKRKEEAVGKPTPKRPPTLDEMLDEALDETFPASDAVAITAPSKTIRTRAGVQKLTAKKGA